MSGVTLDAGALIALDRSDRSDRSDRKVLVLLARANHARRAKQAIVTSGPDDLVPLDPAATLVPI